MNNLIKKDNFFLIAAHDIHEICKPLNKLGITCFTYLKKTHDGSQIYLSNLAEWIEDYYNLGLYNSSSFEKNTDSQIGYYIWPKADTSTVYVHGRDKFDSDNGITLIHKSDKVTEFYFFSGPVKSQWLHNFYLNNLDLLDKFVLYFRESASKLIMKADKNPIILPELPNAHKNSENQLYLHNNTLNLRADFLHDISCKEHISENSSIIISEREKQVAFNILKGKTAIEIADKLFISRKTVERHIENMKIKLHCKNKAELIKQLLILENMK